MDYRYRNAFHHAGCKYLHPFKMRHRVLAGIDCVIQTARARGYRDYQYERREVLPQLFYEYMFSRNTVEIGLIGSYYHWNYNESDERHDNTAEGKHVQKARVGWIYDFGEAKLLLTISHVLSISGFDGANVQYVTYF